MRSIEVFISACRERGLNVTYQRILIYKALLKNNFHPTAEDIFKTVKTEYPSISLATVYKTLETFSENGLLSKVTELHDLARYDADLILHHHLLCTSCKKVVDIHDESFNQLPMPDKNGFNVSGYRILFEGICSDCNQETVPVISKTTNREAVTFCGKSSA